MTASNAETRATPPVDEGGLPLRWGRNLLLFNLALTAAKIAAWWMTRSAAIFSDALESVANIATASLALYALWLAAKPRDKDHPYGHGKVEYFSSGIEGTLILVAGVTITVISVQNAFRASQLVEAKLTLGLAIEILVALVLWAFGTISVTRGKKLESPTIISGGEHLRADAITTFGVVAGLIVVKLTGWTRLDPIVAGLFGLVVVRNGFLLLRDAIGGLMDEANPALLDEIAKVLERTRRPGWSTPHHTKVHRLGQTVHIDLHLVFPRFWTIEQAHDGTEQVEVALCEVFGNRTDVMIHSEPCRPTSCSLCDLADCHLREAALTLHKPWTGPDIAATSRLSPPVPSP